MLLQPIKPLLNQQDESLSETLKTKFWHFEIEENKEDKHGSQDEDESQFMLFI